jgi:hypothetical protein
MWYRKSQNKDEDSQILDKINLLKNVIASAAQKVYDKWDPSDVETYADGGICNLIAPEIANVIQKAFPEYIVITSILEDPNHEFVQLIKVSEDEFYTESLDREVTVFDIDIPYYIYEISKGPYCWKKIENIQFDTSVVSIEKHTEYLSDIRYDY